MKQLEGQMSIFDIWAPKKYPGVQNIYEYVNHPDWMNADRRNEVEEWLIEHPEDIDSYKASKMLKRNEYPAIIKSLVSELIEMFGDDAISEPFTYDVWEHVPNLGARLFIVIDNQTQWDLTEIISRYKKVNLEIDPTECPGDEEGKEDIYISTMWTTPKHKENLGEAPKKHVKQCQDNVCKFSQHECNKDELWKVADSLDDIKCPHVCCRKCTVRCCGARCNGSVEPVGQCTDNVAQDEWINPDECLPEKSGYYFVRDVKGQEYKTWFELTTHGFNHGKNYAIEAWKAMPQEEKAVCPDGKWDKKCATCSQWHFNKYADCSCSHVDCKGPDYKSYDALIRL